MLTHAILTDSARLCAARVEFAFRTFTTASPAQLALCVDALQKIGGTNAHEIDQVGVLNKVGRKRCPRKVVGFPVAGPLGGARTPVRRNGTGPSRGKARGGYTSPIPAEIGWMRWVYLGRGPLVRPHRRKGFMGSPFSKGPSVRGVTQWHGPSLGRVAAAPARGRGGASVAQARPWVPAALASGALQVAL